MMAAVRRAFLLVALLAAGVPIRGHDVVTTKITWSREVSRIVYARCLSCHRDGSSAFSLASYAEARPWAKAIQEEVLARRMPPWNAVKGFGQFRDERGLTQEEISLIAEWAEGGAPEGNLLHLPQRPPADDPRPRPPAREIAVTGSVVLHQRVEAIGIRVKEIPTEGMLQVIAVRPDASVEPLLWVRKSNSADRGEYWFRSAMALPARTRVETQPKGVATLLIR